MFQPTLGWSLGCDPKFILTPLKHGYVKAVADWPFSTFHRYVDQKIYDNNWGYGLNLEDLNFGE